MSDCCNEDQPIIAVKGVKGDAGINGWSPLLVVASDGARRVLKIIGWTGGSGNSPAYTNQYLGASGIVTDITDAVDIRGATGTTGTTGNAGWTAVLANVTDGARIVQQIVDWTGGGGTEPSVVNQFIGPLGIVNTAAAATNIRGATGAAGADGSDVTLPSQTGHDDEFLTTNGTVTSWSALPSQFPSILSNTRRILREKPDGSGVEWYTSFSSYLRIPMVQNGIFNSTTSFVTLRNTGSTVFLKTALPNDATVRKIFVSASISTSHTTGDADQDYCHFAIRDITNNVTLTDEIIETAFRKTPTFQYIGTFTCAGQEIGIQFKHESGQDASGFIGGHISFIEIQ